MISQDFSNKRLLIIFRIPSSKNKTKLNKTLVINKLGVGLKPSHAQLRPAALHRFAKLNGQISS